ncbi:MAG: hypothetical protein EOP00_07375 [Pedobacter sp.]|nr:MAG: hypothetical protein EOP00_07375 [Pedobacter sp.]
MENQNNVDGLGKNHDKAAHDEDIAKKQSEAQPAAENLDMMPNSVNRQGGKDFDSQEDEKPIHEKGDEYAKQEHEKADNWENKSK